MPAEEVVLEPAACVVVTVAALLVLVLAFAWAAAAIQPLSASMPTALIEPAASRARRAGCALGRRLRCTASVVVGFVSIGLPSQSATRVASTSDDRGDSSDQAEDALGLLADPRLLRRRVAVASPPNFGTAGGSEDGRLVEKVAADRCRGDVGARR